MRPTRPDWIHAAPIQRVIENWLGNNGDNCRVEFCSFVWPETHKSTGDRRLRSLMEQEWITFDLADTILCRLHLSHLWLEDADLRDIYQGIDLTWLDYAKPTCPEVDRRNRSRVRAVYEQVSSVKGTRLKLGLPKGLVANLLEAA